MIPSTAIPQVRADAGVYPANGSTFVVPMPEDSYFETHPGRMRLSHDGNHWTGHFQPTLRSLLGLMISEGPIGVTLSTSDTSLAPGERMTRYSGTVVALTTDDLLLFEDGVTIALRDILDIEF